MIIQDHVTWRRQERAALTRAANNRQLAVIASLAERLALTGHLAPPPLRHRLGGYLQNLRSDAGFTLGLALGAEMGRWVAPDLDVFRPAAIAEAAARSIDSAADRTSTALWAAPTRARTAAGREDDATNAPWRSDVQSSVEARRSSCDR